MFEVPNPECAGKNTVVQVKTARLFDRRDRVLPPVHGGRRKVARSRRTDTQPKSGELSRDHAGRTGAHWTARPKTDA